jgi:hypothetical protein
METGSTSSAFEERGAMARTLTVALGVWLFVSAFAWSHTWEQQTNSWITGVLTTIVGLAAMFVDTRARFGAAAIAVWLMLSTFALPSMESGTIWNNVIVALAVIACSLVPGGKRIAPIGGIRRSIHA